MVMQLRQKKTLGMMTRIIPPKIRLNKMVDTRQIYRQRDVQVAETATRHQQQELWEQHQQQQMQLQDRQDEKLHRDEEKTKRDDDDDDDENNNQDKSEEDPTLQVTNVRRRQLSDGFVSELEIEADVHRDETTSSNTYGVVKDSNQNDDKIFSFFKMMSSMTTMNDNICSSRFGPNSPHDGNDDDKVADPDTQLLAYAAVQSEDGEIDDIKVKETVRGSAVLTKDTSSKWKISSAGSETLTGVREESSDRIILALNDTRDVVPESDRDNTSIKSVETSDTADGNEAGWMDYMCGPRSAKAVDNESDGQSYISTQRSGIDTVSIATDEVSDFLSFLEDEMKKYSAAKRAKREKLSGRLIDVEDDGDQVSLSSLLEHADPKLGNSKPTFARIRTNGTNLRTQTLSSGRWSTVTERKFSSTGRKQVEPSMDTVEKRINELESRLEAESTMNRELMTNLRSLRDEIRCLRDDESSDMKTKERSNADPEPRSNNAIWKRMKMIKKIPMRKSSKSKTDGSC
mmetsp:Transcript_32702/g.79472  ORF Transcript_32702/g.79472 Transcript_32702/m.79472 type:complete len:515 (+) Transcript_32702:148-1692(+)